MTKLIPETTRSRALLEVLQWVKEGKLGLPEFQRDFVWSRRDIEELLTSLLRGYFIGTFLFLKVNPDNIPFKARPIQGVEITPRSFMPEMLILDGQQRITSLYYAFYAPRPELITPKYTKKRYLFFLNLEKLEEDKVEDAVFSLSEDDQRVPKYSQEAYQFEKKVIPFIKLRSKEEWIKWRDKYKEYQQYKNDRWVMRVVNRAKIFKQKVRDKAIRTALMSDTVMSFFARAGITIKYQSDVEGSKKQTK